MIGKPAKVPQKEISSIDVPNFAGGLYLQGAQNAPNNSFIDSKDVELSTDGYIVPRRKLVKFLPDTVESVHQIFPVLWEGEIFYFTADDGKIRFCQEGDNSWTDCGDPEVTATLTTALTGTDNDIKFTSVLLGPAGNDITITLVDPAANDEPLAVAVVDTDITVTLATDGSGTITSTAAEVITAVLADVDAAALVAAENAPSNDGTGIVTALAQTPLAGGDGTNFFTTNNGGKCKFLRVLNCVLILNGGNGDKLAHVDLTVAGFPVVKHELVDDPTNAPTAAATGITGSGDYTIYYAVSFAGSFGETALGPILTQAISKPRDQWTPGTDFLTITRNNSAPTGAKKWNLYVALSSTAGTIQVEDMLPIALGLDLPDDKFIDNGQLDINLGSPPPLENNTEGPRVQHGIVEDGNPVLYGDIDNPYNIHIGGGGLNAMSLSISDGGYRAEPEKGTNFYPTTIIGFRTGQGIPALTVLYSNTEGLSKQAVLQQQVVTYGNQSFTVWGVTEQHYGAAGVAAPNSAINYNGKLLFLSTDGFSSMETQPSVQNVLSTKSISSPIDEYVRGIKNSAMPHVVGAGWNNKYMWLVPNAGFDSPQQLLVLDTNNKGINGDGAWYSLAIQAQWIGVVSPQDTAAFVYIVQGNKSYKLLAANSTYDSKDGINAPFSTKATGPLLGMGGNAHNTWQADVQTMFYIMGLVGEITVGVTYRNQNGKLKTKSKTYHGPSFTPSGAGGWGDPAWSYSNLPSWADVPGITNDTGVIEAVDVRIPVRVDDVMNEAQWFFTTPIGYQNFKIRAVSFEGINLGVRPDLTLG